MSGNTVKVYPLKRITQEFIVQKGFDEAREAKDLLWSSKFKEAREMVREQKQKATNMWSMMRGAEVEVRESEWHLFAIILTRWQSVALDLPFGRVGDEPGSGRDGDEGKPRFH